MDVLGIIFANIYDSSLGQLTNKRTMASLPFGGRYRHIDFPLSNMANAGIHHIGIITKYNYQSLINHVGSGLEWDLALGEGNMEFLTPFSMGHSGTYRGKLEAVNSAAKFIAQQNEEYVILSDSNVLCSIDLSKVLEAHIASGCDVTAVTKSGIADGKKELDLAIKTDDAGQVTQMAVDYVADASYDASMGIFVMKRTLLMEAAKESTSRNRYRLERDFILRSFDEGKITMHIYPFADVALFMESTREYYQNNLRLLQPQVRQGLFKSGTPVYTSVRNEVPAYFGDQAKMGNCIIGDGCSIEGSVDESVLFRNVKVEAGVTLKHCVAMQGCVIGAGAQIAYAVLDKGVVVRPGSMLIGTWEHPVIISKGETV